jgi:hypothetical protein
LQRETVWHVIRGTQFISFTNCYYGDQATENKVGEVCNTAGELRNTHNKCKIQYRRPGVDGKLILKCTLKKKGVETSTGLNYLRIC